MRTMWRWIRFHALCLWHGICPKHLISTLHGDVRLSWSECVQCEEEREARFTQRIERIVAEGRKRNRVR